MVSESPRAFALFEVGFTQHLVLDELSQLNKNSGPYFIGLSDTVSPLLITPPSLALIVNVIGQDADPVGFAISLLRHELVNTQEPLVHSSRLVE